MSPSILLLDQDDFVRGQKFLPDSGCVSSEKTGYVDVLAFYHQEEGTWVALGIDNGLYIKGQEVARCALVSSDGGKEVLEDIFRQRGYSPVRSLSESEMPYWVC